MANPTKETSFPKTTRPAAKKQRVKEPDKTTSDKIHKTLDAFPDKIDIRDWFYHPGLAPLPDQVIHFDDVPVILDQGKEGACTGFALSAVINYHLLKNGRYTRRQIADNFASPYMLYEMARRYDEWPGQDYAGSSARGTMKGWLAHGVARVNSWKPTLLPEVPVAFTDEMAREALAIPAGAFYRVLHRQVRDMHAAINESGVLYATLMVHPGWLNPGEQAVTYTYTRSGKKKSLRLPVIQRKLPADGGHAVAVVGYTKDGFIVQNSWGSGWGNKGFALLTYEDWMLHASDCWVVQIGVPLDINLWNVGTDNSQQATQGVQRASQLIPLDQIRPYVVNIGNNGRLSDSGDYWTTESDVVELFNTIGTTAANWKKKRIMLYLHGGLNSEKEVARRIISYKQVCLENEIYPVHIMWETDFWNSLKDNLLDIFSNDDRAQANWLSKLREGAAEILDRTFELTAAKPGTMLWEEMKENAELAAENGRAMDILAKAALAAYETINEADRGDFELHIVGHSAGCIFTAYTLGTLLRIGVPVKTMQFMAPAISVELFKEKLLPAIRDGKCPVPINYILSDVGERDDQVGPYGKSLLYLVSNAFERKREKPILGMEKFVNANNPELKKEYVDDEIGELYSGTVNGWPSLVIAGRADASKESGPSISRAQSHSGFDNDSYTLNSVLYRILGKEPGRKFETRDLQY